jgi:medium-chain acyl-[acyl-carrier-protein] hydrolase
MHERLGNPVSPTPWARRYFALAGAPELRLLCFGPAGGGASGYRDWWLPDDLAAEVWAVQLPGRENRRDEPPFRRIEPLVLELCAHLGHLMDLPFAFFGHSMGALLAFEVTRQLRRAGSPLPAHLFLSAHRAPGLPAKQEPVSMLPEREFLERLELMAGTSPSAIRDRELLVLLSPMLRADFELCETYAYHDEAPLPVPITCFAADDDYEVDPPDVEAWSRHTSMSCQTHLFQGGHLFLRDHHQEILGHIGDLMAARRGLRL